MANKDNIKKHIFDSLDEILEQRKTANSDESYVAKLFNEGVDSILKKVSEEATETVIASKCSDNAAIIHEIADLWFHTLILLKYHGLDANDVLEELGKRLNISGIEEKANRNK
jgi:phosphoribosyl-ATP pyrophosphohydrolase